MNLLRGIGSTLALVRAGLRAERGSSILLFALVLATAAVAASVPKLVDRTAGDGLRHALEGANAVERNLVFVRQTHKLIDVEMNDHGALVPTEEDPLAAVERAGGELAEVLPETIARAVVDEQFVVDSAQYLGVGAPQPLTHLRLRYQSGIDEHIRYAEGRPPSSEAHGPDCPADAECHVGPSNPEVTYEVAVSRGMADALQLAVGDHIVMQREGGTTRPRPGVQPTPGDRYIGVVITGIFEIIDPADDFWLRDTSLERPTIQPVSINLSNYYGAALVDRETYRVLPGLIDYTYAWRFRLDPARIDAAALPRFERDLRRLEAQYPLRPPGATDETASLSTGLSAVLADYRAQRASTEAALAFIAAGPLIAVGGSLVLIALLWVQRRKPALLYLRQRGATSAQVLGRTLGEVLLLAIPGAALGLLLADALVAGSLAEAAAAAVAASGLAVVAVLAAALPTARAALGEATYEEGAASRSASRRLVLDGLVVGLAVVGAVSLAERGPVSEAGGVEPFLVVVPALVGVAAGIILLRVYPLPIRALSWLARRTRGFMATHALRVSGREGGLSRLPLLVLLLAAALAVFSSGILVTLERGQLASSWQQMGADYVIEARFGDVIPLELEVGHAEAVSVATRGLIGEAALSSGRARREAVPLLAVDPAAYTELLAATPAALTLPRSFDGPWPSRTPRTPVGSAIGSADNPLPAVISSGLAEETGASLGQTAELTIPGGRTTVRVDGVRDTLPGLAPGGDFVLLPFEALRAAYPDQFLLPTRIMVRADPRAETELRALIQPFERRVGMASRHGLYRAIHDAPLAAAIGAGLQLALVVTLAYGVVALAASSVLSLVARRREIVLLRTLGVRSRQLAGLLLLGQAPGVAAALALGVALGLGLAALLLPSLGLEAFTGPGVTIRLGIEPIHVALAVVLPAAVALGLTVAGAWSIGRGNLAAIIRGGEGAVSKR